jgi:Ca-activated chloride channel family protein
MGQELEYYRILELSRDATPEEVRSAYFAAAKRLHPDTNPDPSAGESFLQVKEAYDALSNPQKRTEYDSTLPAEKSRPAVKMDLQYSRSILPRLKEKQLVYALLEMTCTADPEKADLPSVHVCLVIDRSTSMQGSRIEMVKANVIQLFRQLNPMDMVSVVAFSDRAEVIIPPTRANELGKMDHRISLLQTGGSTEIFQGLKLGIQQMRMAAGMTAVRHTILLTDGHTYGDEQNCMELAKKAAQEGIVINGLGLGHEWNDTFLDELTGISGGSSMFVSQPQDLHKFLKQKLTAIGMVYGNRLSLELNQMEDVESFYAFRLGDEAGPLPISNNIALGDLLYKTSLSILFEFTLKPMKGELWQISMLSGRLVMDIPNRVVPRTRFFIEMNRQVAKSPAPEQPSDALIKSISNLSLYRLQEKARKEVANGEIAQATRHLQNLATHLLSRGERELARATLMEAENVQTHQCFSQEGEKRIKYGTRALLLPSGLENRS